MNMVLVFPIITVAMERYETVRGDVLQQQIAGIYYQLGLMALLLRDVSCVMCVLLLIVLEN